MQLRRPLDRLAALDPTGLVGPRVVGAARLLPGVALGERVGGAVLDELERRLEAVVGERRRLPAPEDTPLDGEWQDEPPPVPAPAPARRRATPARLMDALLRESGEQDPAAGEQALVEMLLGELVPDEARILVALSDGSAFPVLDLVARSGPDAGRTLLAGVSNVGRLAGAVLPARTPIYLTHMAGLGLVERGEEDPGLAAEYADLLEESAVREARAAGSGLRRPRAVRGTVRISALGRTVWASSRDDG